MNYLSLFSGVEGGGLAFQHLIEPKITCIGYVEIDDYCQKVIRQRQIDGLLDKAPIFGDIRTFIDSGCAELYRGITDVVTGGFPCQPFSSAGKQLAERDNKNMWPETIKAISIIRPKICFLENVSNLLIHEYFGEILKDLSESGYNAKWKTISAAEVGAKHFRNRVWIVANSKSNGIKHDIVWPTNLQKYDWGVPERNRKVDGLANRMDRLKAIGNGQVPQVAALAWEILKKG